MGKKLNKRRDLASKRMVNFSVKTTPENEEIEFEEEKIIKPDLLLKVDEWLKEKETDKNIHEIDILFNRKQKVFRVIKLSDKEDAPEVSFGKDIDEALSFAFNIRVNDLNSYYLETYLKLKKAVLRVENVKGIGRQENFCLATIYLDNKNSKERNKNISLDSRGEFCRGANFRNAIETLNERAAYFDFERDY